MFFICRHLFLLRWERKRHLDGKLHKHAVARRKPVLDHHGDAVARRVPVALAIGRTGVGLAERGIGRVRVLLAKRCGADAYGVVVAVLLRDLRQRDGVQRHSVAIGFGVGNPVHIGQRVGVVVEISVIVGVDVGVKNSRVQRHFWRHPYA